MPAAEEIDLEGFRTWVRNALLDARARGMTDESIYAATGITPGTFHRWQSGKFGPEGPKPEKVYAFCDGLKIDRRAPARLLGWTTEGPPVAPAPEIPQYIRELVERLRDPSLDDFERMHIDATIKALLARRYPRNSPRTLEGQRE
jgi:hypothetical protein